MTKGTYDGDCFLSLRVEIPGRHGIMHLVISAGSGKKILGAVAVRHPVVSESLLLNIPHIQPAHWL